MDLSKEEKELYKNMAHNLATIRGSRSQEEIAKVIGMKPSNYNTIEGKKGERHLKDIQIIKLAQYYDVSADYLLGLTKETTTDKDIKYFCNKYGLTEKTLPALELIKKEKEDFNFMEIDTFNYLLEDVIINKQDSILKAINDFLFCQSDYKAKVNIQARIGKIPENVKISQELILQDYFFRDLEYKLKLLREKIEKEGE